MIESATFYDHAAAPDSFALADRYINVFRHDVTGKQWQAAAPAISRLQAFNNAAYVMRVNRRIHRLYLIRVRLKTTKTT